ncbi:MAG: ankyrin repeat domain-containing protein [Bdellovibrionia bacterium]
MKKINISNLFFLSIFLLSSPRCLAEVSHYEFKGVHSLLHPDFEFLSPLHGLRLLQTRELENRRFFGNYGAAREETACGSVSGSRLRRLFVENQDCPQDRMSEWIQRLFPSPDGLSLVANHVASDPISELNSETLGQLLGMLTLGLKERPLTERIQDLLYQGIHPKRYYGGLNLKKQRLEKTLLKRLQGCKDPLRIHELHCEIARLGNLLEASKTEHVGKRSEAKAREKEFHQLAQLFVGALEEQRLGLYPPHFLEQSLLAFFWKKSQSKHDFLELFSGMHQQNPRILSDPSVIQAHSARQIQFLASRYQPQDLNRNLLAQNSASRARELFSDPEKMAFFLMEDQMQDRKLPSLISYETARHPSLKGLTYADCGESSLRNFLNLVFYAPETGRFDPAAIAQQKKNELSFHPNLLKFYRKYPLPALSKSQESRDEWSELVSSSQPGVKYLKPFSTPQCEMDSGIDNMMRLLENLVFYDQPENPLSQARSRKEKWVVLCRALSREGLKLQCIPQASGALDIPNVGLSIELIVNETDPFIWEFLQGHFIFQKKNHTDDSDWKIAFVDRLIQELRGNSSSSVGPWLTWLTTRNHFHAFKELLTPLAHGTESLFYSLPLTDSEEKLKTFPLFDFQDPKQVALAQRLFQKLPESHYTTSRAFELLLKQNMPMESLPLMTSRQRQLALRVLAGAGRVSDLQWMEERFPDVLEERGEFGETLAHWAALKGQVKVLQWMDARFPEAVRQSVSDTSTIAHMAALGGHVEVFQWIEQNAPELLYQKYQGDLSIAHMAALEGRIEALQWIAEQVPEVFEQKTQDGCTIAHMAALEGNVEGLQWIAEILPETLFAKNFDGKTPADVAAEAGHASSIQMIAQYAPEVITQGVLQALRSHFISEDRIRKIIEVRNQFFRKKLKQRSLWIQELE